MTLEKAYKIGLKYGLTFNGVGPSLSIVDGKVGICLNLLDDNFGYIKRNYSFDDYSIYEEFLKKYSYYLRNKEKEHIFISLDNYTEPDAKIIYSYENEEILKKEIDFENKELLVKDMKSFLTNFVSSLDLLRKDIAEKILVEQDYYNKLDYYQKLLYKAFDTEYEEEVMHADKSYIDSFNERIKDFDLSHKRSLASIITENTTMNELRKIYDRLYSDCKNFLENEEYIELLYDKVKFKNNIDSLDEMIDYLLNNPVADETTEEHLAAIKENTKQEDYEDFKESYHEKYLVKYEDVTDFYNENIFDAEKLSFKKFERKTLNAEKKILDLKYLYDDLEDEQKIAVGLVHSPLKSLILYIIEQAYFKNKKLNFDREDFKSIYESVSKGLKNSENLVFKLKYFRNIEIGSYDEFIRSIVKTAKIICTAYNKLPFDLKLYSLNYDSCMIGASDSPIKSGSETINIINAKEGCSYIYSPIRISYDKESNLFSTSENNNVIYFPRYLNLSKKRGGVIVLNLFEESYSVEKMKDKNLLIIDGFRPYKSVKYKYSDMFGKEKN